MSDLIIYTSFAQALIVLWLIFKVKFLLRENKLQDNLNDRLINVITQQTDLSCMLADEVKK